MEQIGKIAHGEMTQASIESDMQKPGCVTRIYRILSDVMRGQFEIEVGQLHFNNPAPACVYSAKQVHFALKCGKNHRETILMQKGYSRVLLAHSEGLRGELISQLMGNSGFQKIKKKQKISDCYLVCLMCMKF
jgi:hypothetical protein